MCTKGDSALRRWSSTRAVQWRRRTSFGFAARPTEPALQPAVQLQREHVVETKAELAAREARYGVIDHDLGAFAQRHDGRTSPRG